MITQQSPVTELTDMQVLDFVRGHGPAIVGQALYDRAVAIRARTNNGQLGPAISDPEYGAKEAARIAAAQAARIVKAHASVPFADDAPAVDDATASADAWGFVTLSGAKMLAMQHAVSYRPGTKREALIDMLKAANITPPKPPARPATEEDFGDSV